MTLRVVKNGVRTSEIFLVFFGFMLLNQYFCIDVLNMFYYEID